MTKQGRFCEEFPGSRYTDEETRFLMAVDRYKRKNQRVYLTWIEVFQIVKDLGYVMSGEQKHGRPH